jgi:hypothetical protein
MLTALAGTTPCSWTCVPKIWTSLPEGGPTCLAGGSYLLVHGDRHPRRRRIAAGSRHDGVRRSQCARSGCLSSCQPAHSHAGRVAGCNVLFCRWSGGGMPALRREARLLRHNPLSMPMSGSLTARRVPLTPSVMLVLNGSLCWGSLRLLTVGSRDALGFPSTGISGSGR